MITTTRTLESLEGLKGAQLVELHNELAKELDKPLVKRFADKKSAVNRTWKLLQAVPKAKAVNVTNAEFVALRACLNYDSREAQLSDNFSNGGHEAFKEALGWDDQAVAALIGSLESKGLVHSENEDGNGNTVWLTESGVNAVFDQIDAGRKAEAPKAKGGKKRVTTYARGETPTTNSFFINAVYGMVEEGVEREALIDRVLAEVAPPRSKKYDRTFVQGYLAHMVQRGWLIKTTV